MSLPAGTKLGREVAIKVLREKKGQVPFPFDQKFIDIMRKTPDGSWERWQHMWSSSNKQPSIWD